MSWSHSSENLQHRMVRIISANQITWTVIQPFYHGHILRRIYKIRWSELYRPIISLGRLFNCYKRSQSSEASSRSDGQTLKPRRLRAKVGLSRPQLSRYAQNPYLVRTSRLERISRLRANTYLTVNNRLKDLIGRYDSDHPIL